MVSRKDLSNTQRLTLRRGFTIRKRPFRLTETVVLLIFYFASSVLSEAA